MKNQFIPYEEALELKELGFNEESFGYYAGNELITSINEIFKSTEILIISAPLYQQAFKFLREMIITRISDESSYLEGQFTLLPLIYFNGYEIHVTPEPTSFTSGVNYDFIPRYEFPSKRKIYKETTLNYDDAQLACLKKMIQIVKNK